MIPALCLLTSAMGRQRPACSEAAAEKAIYAFNSSLLRPSQDRRFARCTVLVRAAVPRAEELVRPRPQPDYCSHGCCEQYLGCERIVNRPSWAGSAAGSWGCPPAAQRPAKATITGLPWHFLERAALKQLVLGDAEGGPAASLEPALPQQQVAHLP